MNDIQLQDLQTQWITTLQEKTRRLSLIGDVPKWAQKLKNETISLQKKLQREQYKWKSGVRMSASAISTMNKKVEELSWKVDNLSGIQNARTSGEPWAFFETAAISNTRIIPDLFPIPGNECTTIKTSLCRGEYESESFVILALTDVQNIEIKIGNLEGPEIIPAENIDCSIVKTWWQAGKNILSPLGIPTLAPELLLKDDALVKVDYKAKQNYVRSTNLDGSTEYVLASSRKKDTLTNLRPIDAKQLQPFSIPSQENRQIWLTIHAPENAVSGIYQTTIEVSTDHFIKKIPLQVEVHSFDLENSPLIYSMYYRGVLGDQDTISSDTKNRQQYLADMKDLKAHGVLYPTIYQGYGPLLDEALTLRAEAGLPAGPLYVVGMSTGNSTGNAELKLLGENVQLWKEKGAQFGYDDIYIYGLDEAVGNKLLSQRTAWKTVHAAGGKVFVACFAGSHKKMGDLLDLAVVALKPQAKEAALYHSTGKKIFCYLNPQGGEETPLTYRRNFGISLYQAHYDGSMNYAYQHGFGHVWNDFDGWPWRDHNYTYPAVDGIISTRQWEGFREAVDDVRYLATLKKAIADAKEDTQGHALQAQNWLDSINTDRDLQDLRKDIVKWIKVLKG